MAAGPAAAPVPVSVLTGFLGAGKTTLLNHLLRQPGMAGTAVLVNEFGAIGVDHLLVEAVAENVVLLGSGCLCCTIRDDLTASLAALIERRDAGAIPDFRRVMLETSGLADPAPILHALLSDRSARARCSVDAIVTVVDAVNGARTLGAHPEAVRQAAVADRLVISKTDLVEAAGLGALRERLRSINAGASIVEACQGAVAPGDVLGAGVLDPGSGRPDVAGWLRIDAGSHAERDPGPGHTDRVVSIALEADAPIEIVRFVGWVEALLDAHGDRILRLKGILDAAGTDAPVVVHGVQHVFHPLSRLPAWPDGARRSRVVVIGTDIDPGAIERGFRRAVLD